MVAEAGVVTRGLTQSDPWKLSQPSTGRLPGRCVCLTRTQMSDGLSSPFVSGAGHASPTWDNEAAPARRHTV